MNPTVNLKKVKVLTGTNLPANTSATSSIATASAGVVSFFKNATVFARIVFSKIAGFAFLPSLNESVSKYRYTWNTAAANTEYGFYVRQEVPNNAAATGLAQEYVSASFTVLPTNTQIGNALKAQLETLTRNSKLKVAVSYVGGNGYIDVDGSAGFPIIEVLAPQAGTVASNLSTIAPNGTAANAIVDNVAPHGTPATAIAGTTTVTVTTAAAHGLAPGDVVDIASVATMTLLDTRTGQSSLAAVSNVVIATVPTTSTFTLQGIIATGTNSGTITIQVKNKVRVLTLAAHGLSVGDSVAVASIATFTVDGAATVSGRVESVPSTTTFWLVGAGNNSASNANTGTITITKLAQESRGLGSQFIAAQYADSFGTEPLAAIDEIVAATKYTEVIVNHSATKSVSGTSIPALGEQTENLVLLLDEADAQYAESLFRLKQVEGGKAWNSYVADPNLL